MEHIQFTLTVEEGKALLARGVMQHPRFIEAQQTGKILLKGGTTVSRVAELAIGTPLRISGRITSRGTVS